MASKIGKFIAGIGLAANIASGQPIPDQNSTNTLSLEEVLKGSPEKPGIGEKTKSAVTEIIDIKFPETRVEASTQNNTSNEINPISNLKSLEESELTGFLDNNKSSNVKSFKTKSDTLFNVYGVSKEVIGTSYNGVGLDIRGKQFEIKTEKGKNHTLIGGVGVLDINEDFYLKGGAGLLNLDQLALGTEGTKYDVKSTNIGAAVGYRGTISDSTHTNLEIGRISNSVTGTFGKVTGNTDFIEAAVEKDFDSSMKARLAGSLEKTTAKTTYGDSFNDTKSTLSAAFYPIKDLELEMGYTGLDLHKGDYNAKVGVSIPFTEKGFKSPRLFVSANKNITTHNTASITYQTGIANVDMSLKDTFERNILTTNINPTMSKGVNSQVKKYEEEQRLRNTTPNAVNDTTSTPYNTSKTGIDVLANDTYTNGIAPTLSGAVPTNQLHGTFTVNNGKIDMVPELNYTGPASCIYEIQGANGLKSTATLTVNVGADDVAPNAPTGLSLNSGATYTNSTTVNLDGLTGPGDASHWFVSESSSAPLAGDAGWVSSKPTTYTMSSGDGVKTVYVYVKDATGNVQSAGVSDTITLDTIAPSAPVSFVSPRPNAANTNFTVTVSVAETSSGLNQSTINITTSTGSTISNISTSGSNITFDIHTSTDVGDQITISGEDNAGNSFSGLQSDIFTW